MQLVVEVAIDRAGVVPVEPIERLRCAECRHLRASLEIPRLALALLEGAELLSDLSGRRLRLRRMNEECVDRFARCADADLAKEVGEVGGLTHRNLRDRGGRRRVR